MAQRLDVDVAIVGGSHAGLAMSVALARTLGPEPRLSLIERRGPGPAAAADADPRAFAISAGSRRLLQALGVWTALAPHAEPVSAIDITDSSLDHAIRPVLLTYDNRLEDGETATHIIEAWRLGAALADAAQTLGSLRHVSPGEVAAMATGPASAALTLGDGTEVRARLVVAADGARSPLREAAGICTTGWSYPQTGIVTVVRHGKPHGGRAVQHFLPAGPFAILPLKGDRSCITWTEETSAAARILALDDAAFLAEVERRFGHRLGELSIAGARVAWPLELRLARALIAPRLALIGDAARTVHPIAGQGLNLGLRDVAALTEAVAGSMRVGLDPSDSTGLERYQSWRRFDGQASAAAYDALNRLFSSDAMLVRAVRGAGLGLVDRLPGLKQLLVAEAAGMTGEVPRLLRGELP
jgi:2-octaprenyl-6-methoxyphenol hydroxylase